MITAKLLGGLSNQMFQIAAVHALAWQYKDECAFPLDRTEMGQGRTARNYACNIFRHIKELPKNFKPKFRYDEPIINGNLQLNYRPIPYHKNMEVRGYFPSEKYFKNYKKEIINLYKDRDLIKRISNDFKKVYSLENSLSLHVRRGDYLKSPDFMPVLPIDYYQRAIYEVELRSSVDIILVFSDDIEWCKLNLRDKRMVFIEDQLDYADLYLMSECTNNITANSGFSWWGSYLNENASKIVVCPYTWFGKRGPQGFTDQYTDNMILI
jgi:hypothetical protein